ncbi:unnamed protein product [Urochloa humidicola]
MKGKDKHKANTKVAKAIVKRARANRADPTIAAQLLASAITEAHPNLTSNVPPGQSFQGTVEVPTEAPPTSPAPDVQSPQQIEQPTEASVDNLPETPTLPLAPKIPPSTSIDLPDPSQENTIAPESALQIGSAVVHPELIQQEPTAFTTQTLTPVS